MKDIAGMLSGLQHLQQVRHGRHGQVEVFNGQGGPWYPKQCVGTGRTTPVCMVGRGMYIGVDKKASEL